MRVLYLGATAVVDRPKGQKANASITFGEVSPRNPPPIAAWYPTGAAIGHAFRY